MWKLGNKFFLFFVLILFSVNYAYCEYMEKGEVVKLDNTQHERCINEVDMKSNDALEFYWSCRVNAINDFINKIKNSREYGRNYKKELQNIKRVIMYRKEEAMDKIFQEKYNKRYVQTVFLHDDDWYYFDIINEKFSSEIIYIQQIKQTKEKQKEIEIKDEKEKLRRESTCYKYKSNKKNYNKCLESLRLSEICISTLENSVLEKELEYRYECLEKANEKYPDSLVLFNNEYERLVNLKKDKYIINREEDVKINKRKHELNGVISGPKLSKQQLVELRTDEKNNCIADRFKDLNMFRSILLEQCEKVKQDIK